MMQQLAMLILLLSLCDLTRHTAADQPVNEENVPRTQTYKGYDSDPCSGYPVIITEPTTIRFPATSSSSSTIYDDYLECVWRILAPEDYVVEVVFQYMDIEDCTDCGCDSLSIYNGDLTTLIRKVCSPLREESDRVYSYFNHMDLKFYSDYTYGFQGFVADVNFLHKPTVAFFVVKTANIVTFEDQLLVDFDEIRVNLYDSFNQDSNSFSCPIAGDYFFSISAGAMAKNPVGLILRKNGNRFVSLVRESVVHDDVDTLSRSVIISLNQGDVIDLVVDSYTSAYSDQRFQTSLTGFMLPFVHGQYTNTGLFVGKVYNATSSPYMFDKRLVGGSEWGNSKEIFKIPYKGFYMCSMSAAFNETTDVRDQLEHNTSIVANIYRTSDTYIGFDTLSRDIFIEAASSEDTLSMTSYSSSYQNPLGTPGLQTSLSVYMISLPENVRPLFSAYMLSDNSTSGGIVTGFGIHVQVGTGFDGSTGVFTCQVPGVYFVTFSAETWSSYPVDLTLNATSSIYPDRPHGGLTRLSTSHNGYDTLSRSVLIELAVGDEMYLYLAPGGYLSEVLDVPSFSAFLLDASLEFLRDELDTGSLTGILK